MGRATVLTALVLCAVLPTLGCAARGPAGAPSTAPALAPTPAQAIAEKLGAGRLNRPVHIRISPSTEVGAYAWPGGQIVLTRGLVELLDENELAAAIAHELGHLVEAAPVPPPAALRGHSHGPDVESRADAAGCSLLASAGYPPDAMARMLSKVARTHGMTAACRARLEKRVALLHRASPSPLAGEGRGEGEVSK